MPGYTTAVGKLVFYKVFAISLLSTLFSPLVILTTLLLCLGVPYLLNRMVSIGKKKDFTFKFFKKNISVIFILFLFGLCLNICTSKEAIVKNTTDGLAPYEKMCTIIPGKMLDQHMTSEEIKDAMKKSGCNADAFAAIKILHDLKKSVTPGLDHQHHTYKHKNMIEREDNDT
jgi:hypothetical protein